MTIKKTEEGRCEDCYGAFVRSARGGTKAKYCPPCRQRRNLANLDKLWLKIEESQNA